MRSLQGKENADERFNDSHHFKKLEDHIKSAITLHNN